MKKIIVWLLLATLLCAGCSQQTEAETTATTAPTETVLATEPAEKPVCYILYAIGPEDDLMEADIMQDELVQKGFGYDEMYLEFYSDGTGYMNLMGVEGEICHNGTAFWRPEDPENITEYTIEGNILTIDNDGYLYIFEH